MRGLIRFIDQRRYLLASLALFALMTIQTLNEQWSLDFWGHSAVVRELATHPSDPMHPMLLLDAPHPNFSPYLLAVGWLGRLLRVGPIPALQIVGLVNLVLFLVGFRLFVLRLTESKRAPFYALLFAVILWGPSSWRWSGFINLNSLGFGLPFPSMFAVAVTLLAMVALIDFLDRPHVARLAALTIAAALVLLTHPITAIIGGIFAVALVVADFKTRRWRRYIALLGAASAGLLLTLAWPYFPLLRVLTDPALVAGQNIDSRPLYEQVLQRSLPALLMLPFLAIRMRANWRDPLGLAFTGGLLLYLWGAVTQQFVYGRMLALPMLVLHIAFAGFVAEFEDLARRGGVRRRVVAAGIAGISILLAMGLIGASAALVRMVPSPLLPVNLRDDPRLAKVSDTYGFLTGCTGQYDVILTDLGLSSVVVPTFGGKVVAPPGPTAFVPDWEMRAADVKTYFRTSSSAQRRRILDKHNVSFVLLNVSQFDRAGAGVGKRIARHEQLVLVSTSGKVCAADTT